ncbi:MAG: xanthine dehydrogenase family protein molybdopterin-binding subunit [Nitrososphaerales archaeon]
MLRQAPTERKAADATRRVEDPRFLTGAARFLDDVKEEGTAYMGFVHSPHPRARIKSIDLSMVRSSPAFIASLTGEDLIKAGIRPVAQNPWPRQRAAKRYHLAVDEVRFAGEPVAAILVSDAYSVEDLLEQVEVEYEPLPAVVTIEESKKGEILVYDDWKDNVSQTAEQRKGDPDRAISAAPHVIRRLLGIGRQAGAPIETHCVLVSYDRKRERFEVSATLQSVHGLQGQLASEFGLPKKRFHVKVVDVGGGFGSKGGQSYPWPLVACLFAKQTGLTVKWTASRMEEFLEGAAGRDEYCDVTLACDRDGKIVALKGRIECDMGVSGTQAHMPSLSMWTMAGPYDIPNLDLDVTAYVTNKMPSGPVRGAGAPEGCYFIERAMDEMAREIGLDPLELRRRNVVGPERSDGVDYQALMDTLARSSKYDELLRQRDEFNSGFMAGMSSGPRLVMGIGMSLRGGSEDEDDDDEGGWEGEQGEGGGGQDWSAPQQGTGGPAEEWASESAEVELSFMSEWGKVALDSGGQLTVYTGSSPHGQGHETTFAQLASEELGIPIDRIRVVWGDTDLVPFGVGTFGSRSAATGGSAVVDASRKLKARLLEIASKVLRVDKKSIAFAGGAIVEASRPKIVIATAPEILEKAGEKEVSADSTFTLGSMSYSSGVHLCALILDAETGVVSKIPKYVVVEDCGRMINAAIVEGQIRGGVAHGVSGCLFEGLRYDELGNLLTSTFADYAIPTSMDSPEIQVFHRVTPSTVALNGVKGVGESGTNGSYAAVMNALNDALSRVRPGAQVNTAAATPDSIFASLSGP